MEVSKFSNYWPSHLFAVLFNSISNKSEHLSYSASNHSAVVHTPIATTEISKDSIGNLEQARQQLTDGFSDLITILDSFHRVYQLESAHKSELCERYQRQAIYYAKSLIRKTKKNPETFDLPFEMLQHSDAYHLFKSLQLLKKYQLELPSGWYQTVKTLLNNISHANHAYHEIKEKNAH